MSYEIFVTRVAIKQIAKINKKDIPVLRNRIALLGKNPRPVGHIKLKGEDAYRIRVGDYRVIYEIDDERIIVTVVTISHRSGAYRKK